jgi:hypothetical protein
VLALFLGTLPNMHLSARWFLSLSALLLLYAAPAVADPACPPGQDASSGACADCTSGTASSGASPRVPDYSTPPLTPLQTAPRVTPAPQDHTLPPPVQRPAHRPTRCVRRARTHVPSANLAQDFFVAAAGSNQETPCPSGSTSAAGASSCTCQDGTSFQDGQCVLCPAGQQGTGGACTACAPGSYAANQGMTSCTPADVVRHIAIQPCKPGLTSRTGLLRRGLRCFGRDAVSGW